MEHPSGDVTVNTARLEFTPKRITETTTKSPGVRQTRTAYERNRTRLRFQETRLP